VIARIFIAALGVLLAGETPVRVAAQAPDTGGVSALASIPDIRVLSTAEAARRLPVRLSGTVVLSAPKLRGIFVYDGENSIFVGPLNSAEAYAAGDQVEIEGRTSEGSYAPEVIPNTVRITGHEEVPSASLITMERVFTGQEDGQWISIRGQVRSVYPYSEEPWKHEVEIVSNGRRLSVDLASNLGADVLRSLMDADVVVEGIGMSVVNTRRQFVRPYLLAPSFESIRIITQGSVDPFDVPLREIRRVREFRVPGSQERRTRFKGTILLVAPGALFLRDSTGALEVKTSQTGGMAVGDEVEVVGYLGSAAKNQLQDGLVHKVGSGPPPKPVPARLSNLESGEVISDLVEVEARLVEVRRWGNSQSLLLAVDQQTFELHFAGTLPEQATFPKAGSLLSVSGVVLPQLNSLDYMEGFYLLARGLGDVKVLQSPTWWTRENTMLVVAGAAALVGISLGWGITLRRRVAEKTTQIHEQLAREASLQTRYEELFRNANDMVFSVDSEGKFTSLNRAGERMLGLPSRTVIGMEMSTMFEDLDWGWFAREVFEGRGKSGGALRFDLVTREPVRLDLELSAWPLVVDGHSVAVQGIARDVTERKKTEAALRRAILQAEAANRAKNEFLANISHEIRTPMNGVLGMTQLLLHSKLDRDQKDYTETIRNSAESLVAIINDILDFSKIEAGMLSIASEEFNIRDIVEGPVSLLAESAQSKGVDFACLIHKEVPLMLDGDPGRLRQILLNLLGNAIKFTNSGEVFLEISAVENDGRSCKLLFQVSDTGVGISSAGQERLFQPFSQGDMSLTKKFGGTGLGLAICKRLVELMRGEIGLRSEEGKGSTFHFTLPYGVRAPSTRLYTRPRWLDPASKALVVDHNAASQRALAQMLRELGIKVETFGKPEEALAALKELVSRPGASWPLVFMEASLPGTTGLELARKVRAVAPGAIMALVAPLYNRITESDFAAAGVASRLNKPIRLETLTSCLESLADKQPSAPAAPVPIPAGVPGEAAPGAKASRKGIPPAKPAKSAEPEGRAPAQPEPAPPAQASLRVLLVEDNPINQKFTKVMLKKLGYECVVAPNGQAALETLESEPTFDAILMDCQMPVMDGFEATRHIRERKVTDRQGRPISIIAVTANAMRGDREACLRAGMDEYIAKPVRFPDIIAVLAKVRSGESLQDNVGA